MALRFRRLRGQSLESPSRTAPCLKGCPHLRVTTRTVGCHGRQGNAPASQRSYHLVAGAGPAQARSTLFRPAASKAAQWLDFTAVRWLCLPAASRGRHARRTWRLSSLAPPDRRQPRGGRHVQRIRKLHAKKQSFARMQGLTTRETHRNVQGRLTAPGCWGDTSLDEATNDILEP